MPVSFSRKIFFVSFFIVRFCWKFSLDESSKSITIKSVFLRYYFPAPCDTLYQINFSKHQLILELIRKGGNLIRLDCPLCNNDSYTASADIFRPCPYCGTVFSGKYGIEKRRNHRISKEIPFVFSYTGHNLLANTKDMSEKGLSALVYGSPFMQIGDVINLKIGDTHAEAKVVWVKTKNDKYAAEVGFNLLDKRHELFDMS